MKVERCPVVGPHGFCQHDDGDGYWPAASAHAKCRAEEAIVLGEHVAPNLQLPDGWEWASETAYVHVGPMVGMDDVREVAISREVQKASTPPSA